MINVSTREHSASQGGYLLIEMLIAAAIGCALLGVLLQFAVSAQTAVAVQGDVVDQQQRSAWRSRACATISCSPVRAPLAGSHAVPS
jgi:type II secretory pathway component PulJ